MTIRPPKAAPFDCAICKKPGPPQWEYENRRAIAPICFDCERIWGGGSVMVRGPMDWRVASQIGALASIMKSTSHCIEHGNPYNYA